jgi:hypothetical protein
VGVAAAAASGLAAAALELEQSCWSAWAASPSTTLHPAGEGPYFEDNVNNYTVRLSTARELYKERFGLEPDVVLADSGWWLASCLPAA